VTDPISRLNPTLELLRQRLAEHAQRLDSPGKGASARVDGASPARQDRAASLQKRVAERLKAVDAADPQRDRKQRRIFIESVLALELGDALQADPKALELIERIEQAIETSPDLARQFRAALSGYAGSRPATG
jgi:hypothetical protein